MYGDAPPVSHRRRRPHCDTSLATTVPVLATTTAARAIVLQTDATTATIVVPLSPAISPECPTRRRVLVRVRTAAAVVVTVLVVVEAAEAVGGGAGRPAQLVLGEGRAGRGGGGRVGVF